MKKIIPLESLPKILSKLKSKGKKIVLCHGVFDLIHIGHIKHFNEAKKMGDTLVVTLTPDKFVNKGPMRPAFSEQLRLEAIAALNIVDYVSLNNSSTAVEPIKKLKPNFFCKGPDYKNHSNDITGKIKDEIKATKQIRGKIVYTKNITFSSSRLINKYGDLYTRSQKFLIDRVKKNCGFLKLKKEIENFKKLKVLVIGEIIIDEYIFCETLGKSGKDPILVLRDLKSEEYLGGAAAISKHLSKFCNKITLLSMIGEKSDYFNMIKKNLPKNIDFWYIKKKNSPTIVKKRFIDNSSGNNNKVFGVYKINDEILDKNNQKILNTKLNKIIKKYDLVIVSDYGHGLISKKTAKLICEKSKYLALNAQVNAANVGYHSMRNYRNVSCVIINEKEIRHELRDKNGKIEFLMKKLALEQNITNLIVTRGTAGSILYYKQKNKFNYCGAYSKKVIDKIGAGDAMLSLASLCLKKGFNRDASLLTSSLAAAQSVETIGNKEFINKTQILKTLENILK